MGEMKKDSLIVVPGLGDGNSYIEAALGRWGIHYEVFPMPWDKDFEGDFEARLEGLLTKVDESLSEGNRVSLVGISAGGSGVINAFSRRGDSIHKVVNVCGRLKVGHGVFPTLDFAGRGSPAFIQSVIMCEEVCRDFTESDRSKVMTLRPIFDEVVPVSTVVLEGALNKRVISVEHSLSIIASLFCYSKTIKDFILE